MNKKGFLRIIEAVIAIVLLLGFILYITYKTPNVEFKTPQPVKDSMSSILNQMASNFDLRNCVLINDISTCGDDGSGCECDNIMNLCHQGTKFSEIMKSRIVNYDYACEICKESLSCTKISEKLPKDKTVYADTIFIAPTNNVNDEPRVVRLYFWES